MQANFPKLCHDQRNDARDKHANHGCDKRGRCAKKKQKDKGDCHTCYRKKKRDQTLFPLADVVISVASSAYTMLNKEERCERDTHSSHYPPEERLENI